MQTGGWISCHDHFDAAFVANDPFYQDFLIPCGGRYISAAKVYQDEELVVLLGIHRGRGMQPLDAAEMAVGECLGRHLQTALGLWRRQRLPVQHALVGQAVLARMMQPVMLVDNELTLHFANAAAQRLLDSDPRLHRRGSRLACRHDLRHADLTAGLGRIGLYGGPSLTQDAGTASGPTLRQAVVRVDLGAATPGLLLVLSPLRAKETLGAFGGSDLALVLVHDPALRPLPDTHLLGIAYDLTPAEAQVAARIANGDSPKNIARTAGVSVHTVRSQLGTVFGKVGVCRQAELAAALAGMSAAFA